VKKLMLFVVLSFGLQAQLMFSQAINEEGVKLYGSFHGSDVDQVNLASGHLEVRIPLVRFPQRGGKLALSFSVRLRAAIWNRTLDCSTKPCTTTWAVNGQPPYPGATGPPAGGPPVLQVGADQAPPQFLLFPTGGAFYGPDRAQHPYVAVSGASNEETLDASGISFIFPGFDPESTPAMTLPDGTHTIPPGTSPGSSGTIFEDTSGNQITFNSASITDTMGRTISYPTIPVPTSDFSGCTGELATASATVWNVPGTNGSTNTFKFCNALVHVFAGLLLSEDQYHLEPDGDFSVLQSIILPDGTAWTFGYSQPNAQGVNWGDLVKITNPTGGTISYTWNHITGCVNPSNLVSMSAAVATRTVDANDGTGAHQWQYSGFGGRAIVTDPLLKDTAHTFSDLGGCSLYETLTQYYDGPQSGTPIKTLKTEYATAESNPIVARGMTPTVKNVVPTRVTTTWANGNVSKIETDYDAGFNVGTGGHGIYGKPIAVRIYDYGKQNPGPLLTNTVTSYQWQTNSNYLTFNLMNTPRAVTVYDGGGTQIGQTLSNYDETLPAPSGVNTSFNSTPENGNFRGNVTTVRRWLSGTAVSTPNCPVAVSNGFITQTNGYLDSGLISQTNDPCNHPLTFQYAAAAASGAGVYPTQVCDALNHCTSVQYDYNSGLSTSTTDPNGQATNRFYDNLGRITKIVSPDQGESDFNYPDAVTVEKKVIIQAGSPPADGLFRFNGFGALSQTQIIDPEGDDYTEQGYDALGRISNRTNPHRTTASSADGTTTSLYDALGRVTQITYQDGSVSTTDYSQFPIVTVTDPAGNQRQDRTDALGRLVEVDEPGNPATFVANNYGNLAQDGNFAVFGPAGDIKWQTATHGATNTFYGLNMQDDGNLVKYTPTWNTATPTTTGTASYGTQACVGYRLFSGQTLASGACLQSLNKRFMLVMQTAGNLVLYDLSYNPAHAVFYNSTTGTPGSYLAMQADGNLVIYTASGSPVWSTGSVTGTGNYMLQVQDPGNLVIYRDIWETGTTQSANGITNFSSVSCSNVGNSIVLNQNILMGSCLISSSGRFALDMQTDGNLVLYDRSATPASALWSTATGVQPTPLTPGVALQTLYVYDALGNLLCVEQHGNVSGTGCSASPTSDASSPWRVRRFTYDSLSRLLTAHNPESGTITYAYDADGNVLQKTSPAPNQTGAATQTISYCYDKVHRLTGKAYSAQACPLTSPSVTYTYDLGTNGIGRLQSLTDQAGSSVYTYDVMGRTKSETRMIAGVSKQFSYDYNLDGSLWKLHYPSGRVVTYTQNAAGHTVSAADSNGTTYASAEFYANGAEFKRHQPVIFFQTTLNPRLQPAAIYSNNGQPGPAFINKTYIYGAPQQNNGNITSIVANEDASRTQTFTYDSLNRITSGYSAASSGTYSWGETYTIDAWGNLKIAPMGGKAHGGTFANASDNNNRPLGFTYDAAGNLTNTSQYVYDPENRIQSTAGLTYTYDADGLRVLKSNASTGAPTKRYWMSGGNILAEADGSGNLTAEYVFFGGKRLVRIDLPTNTVHYYLSDHLGSTSKIINAAGVVEEESDYTAFGSELSATSGANHYRFTGKERDSESQLDFFGARYFGNALGRFLTADWAVKQEPIPYANLDNPQSLNLYAYVLNNPLSQADPDGHCCEWAKQKVAQAQQWAKDHPRTVSAVKATGAAIATGAAVVAVVALAPEIAAVATVGAAAEVGLTAAGYGIAASGGAVATTVYATAAITGDKSLDAGAGAAQTVTNPAGLSGTILSGGNLETGEKAAAASDLLTGGKDLLSVDNGVKALGPAATATTHVAGAATTGSAAASLTTTTEEKGK
jgi:RHS repeat-associated protein